MALPILADIPFACTHAVLRGEFEEARVQVHARPPLPRLAAQLRQCARAAGGRYEGGRGSGALFGGHDGPVFPPGAEAPGGGGRPRVRRHSNRHRKRIVG